jgi:1,2-diacylglycerol 3-alpha-glucosyltransferase
MKIGFFTDSYLPRLDGIAISVDTFRQGLEALGHEVYVFCPARPGDDMYRSDPRVVRFRSLANPWYEGYRNTWPFSRQHIDRIAALDLEIIHTHTQTQIGLLGLWAAKKLAKPLFTTAHADLNLARHYPHLLALVALLAEVSRLLGGRPQTSPPKGKTRSRADRLIKSLVDNYFNACDAIVVPSPKMRRQLTDLGVSRPLHVVPTGLDTEAIARSAKAGTSRQRELGMPPGAKVVISTARLVKEKNIALVIRAFAELTKTRDGAEAVLLIAGDGPERKALERLAGSLGIAGSVRFAGRLPREAIWELLGAASVFINVCLEETQGLTICEAVAAGLPVVICDPDISPTVADGENGFVVAAEAHACAKALGRITGDEKLAARMSGASLQLAGKCTVETQAVALAAIYERTLSAA